MHHVTLWNLCVFQLISLYVRSIFTVISVIYFFQNTQASIILNCSCGMFPPCDSYRYHVWLLEDKIVQFQIYMCLKADAKMATTGHVQGSNSRPTWEIPGSNKKFWDLPDSPTLYLKCCIKHSSIHVFFHNQQAVNTIKNIPVSP